MKRQSGRIGNARGCHTIPWGSVRISSGRPPVSDERTFGEHAHAAGVRGNRKIGVGYGRRPGARQLPNACVDGMDAEKAAHKGKPEANERSSWAQVTRRTSGCERSDE